MSKRKNKNKHYASSRIFIPDEGLYSTVEYPVIDGKSTRHRPRRNNPWENLIEEDTYTENSYTLPEYDYSDLDYEDDHDNYYSNDHYD